MNRKIGKWRLFPVMRSMRIVGDDASGGALVTEPEQEEIDFFDEEEKKPSKNPLDVGLRYLTPEEYPVWDTLVDISPQGSIFCKSWWLKAVDARPRVLGYFEYGHLIAGIPLHFERRMGLKICCMPKLIQTWGVIMEPLSGKIETMASREVQILEVFAEHLAQESIFVQSFHPSSQNWLPFYWKGFTQTSHYTYVLEELSSLDNVWEGLAKKQRAKIRKAQKHGLCVKPCSPETVFKASMKTFLRQGKRTPYSYEYLRSLCNAAQENNAGTCFAVEDREGNVHTAGFFIWDSKRGYFLAGGHDPLVKDCGGVSLLIWRLIEFAATRTAIFDFEGSMKQSIERIFRSFGAKRIAYHRIMKLHPWLRACLCLTGRQQF